MVLAAVLSLLEDTSFDYSDRRRWLRSQWPWTVPAAVIYLVLIYFGQRAMQDRKAFSLKKPLFLWNFFLAIFSTLGTVRTVPELLAMLKEGGLHGAICDEGALGHRGPFGQWVWWFCMSKLFELVDTAFLVLRKRPVVFIHWYHHVTVLIFTWFTNSQAISAGRWYLVMNYCVHAIMYAYYAIRTLGYILPRIVPMFVTGLQVTQMLVGFWVTLYAAARALDGPAAPGGQCQTTALNTVAGLALYGSYFVLFFRLFIRSYLNTINGTGGKEVAARARKLQEPLVNHLSQLPCSKLSLSNHNLIQRQTSAPTTVAHQNGTTKSAHKSKNGYSKSSNGTAANQNHTKSN